MTSNHGLTRKQQGIVISNFTNYGFVFGNKSLDGTEAQWRIPIARKSIFEVLISYSETYDP